MIRVLIIGDSTPVIAHLADHADIQVVGEVEFDSQVAPLAAEFWPDVVVFNTDYMVSQVLPAVAELTARIPGCSMLILADHAKPGMLPPRRSIRGLSFLVKDVGVAVVPGSSFYHEPALGRSQVRFTFCKRDETLTAAEERLQKLKSIAR